METIFFLILTFYTWGSSGAQQIESATVPVPYATQGACNAAGQSAADNFNGGAKVEWTCVPAGSASE